jgi:hypothetical protein
MKGTIMSKKMMLLALAVAALFALPSAASAQEIHFKGVTTFTGTGPALTFRVEKWPATSCLSTSINGSFNTGSATTGEVSLIYTGCKLGGFEVDCHTSGAASGTVATSGVFHLITVNSKPGVLVTPVATTLICGGFFNFKVGGNLIGTITSPACGASSHTMGLSFEAEGSTQRHIEYTGIKYDLTSQREPNAPETAGLNSTVTLASSTAGTLECT